MSNVLTWHFDIAVIEWLILLAAVIILTVVGAVIHAYMSLKYYLKPNTKRAKMDSEWD